MDGLLAFGSAEGGGRRVGELGRARVIANARGGLPQILPYLRQAPLWFRYSLGLLQEVS